MMNFWKVQWVANTSDLFGNVVKIFRRAVDRFCYIIWSCTGGTQNISATVDCKFRYNHRKYRVFFKSNILYGILDNIIVLEIYILMQYLIAITI